MKIEILIVDNDRVVREAIQQFLDTSGFTTRVAENGEDGLSLLSDNNVDIVITDTELPGMDGLDFTNRVKKEYNVDVIVLTDRLIGYSYEEAIGRGASDFLFKPVRFEELMLRLKRVLKERTLRDERAKMIDKFKELSITDGLTKLFNSRHFYSQLKNEAGRCVRYDHALSLLILDIDHFKDYNDKFGHLEGDKVLMRMGQVIKLLLRKMDSAYRYGGEEFTIILPETEIKEAGVVAQRIRKAVKKIIFMPLPDTEISISISIGMTQYRPPEDITEFVKRSDKALYQSKAGGRDCVSAL